VTLTAREKEQIGQGVKRFYMRLGEVAGSETAIRLSEAGSLANYEHLIGSLAVRPFKGALTTLISIDPQADAVALQAAGDRPLGRYVLEAFRKRICGDAAISAELSKAINEAKAQGIKITTPTADKLMLGTSTTLALVIGGLFSGPIAVAVAPLVGGVTLFILQVGLDAFCSWAKQTAESVEPTGAPVMSEVLATTRTPNDHRQQIGRRQAAPKKLAARKKRAPRKRIAQKKPGR
jgi:hypothetical protein